MRISDWSSDVCSSDLVFNRKDSVEHLDDGHLGAEVREETRELAADRAGTDYQQVGGHFRRHKGVRIGPDSIAIRPRKGKLTRPRSGRKDDIAGFIFCGGITFGDRNSAVAEQAGGAFDDGHLVFAHE